MSRATVIVASRHIPVPLTLHCVPYAGQNLLGSAQVGEYFRVLIAYAIIAVSLALHSMQRARSQIAPGVGAELERGDGSSVP